MSRTRCSNCGVWRDDTQKVQIIRVLEPDSTSFHTDDDKEIERTTISVGGCCVDAFNKQAHDEKHGSSVGSGCFYCGSPDFLHTKVGNVTHDLICDECVRELWSDDEGLQLDVPEEKKKGFHYADLS